MDFKSDARIDSGSVGGASGGGRGGGIAVGGIGGLIIVVIALFLGIDPSAILGGGSGQTQPQASSTNQCSTGADVQRDADCRWPAYMTSLNQYWGKAAGGNFQPPTMLKFSGSVNTACGQASSQVGPFYCPGDQKIYIDTSFVQQLLDQLGAQGGPAAEAYIVAHEYGHHIENVTGVLEKAQHDKSTGPTSSGVRVELMADCYAGVWFNFANKDATDIIENITQDDLNRVVDAARAVGDDHIQSQQGGVNPDAWTHGSSKMRQYWVQKGFQSGDPNQCDTFATDNLGQ
ncbi:KPN_02809 family neutral zinc metallopeptidase [Aestuariimicrobium kwangyangense]|uniref:KPN_02809 family neutral zinc metallopeptidase n=1 Tax=Aestuariimicrobium kwangyangense TaxID=396389 RepID=UPI0003B4B36E|nr:neutral zinc metallopeptidase [Aestuariimicrobium kwangyangense]